MNKIIPTLMALVLAGCANSQNSADITSNLQGTENKREIHLTEYGKTILLAPSNIYANFVPDKIDRENIPYQIIKVTMENPGLYTYTKWIDENNNEVRDRSELQGMVKTSFNLGEEPIKLLFSNKDYTGNLTLKTWSGQGELIKEQNFPIDQPNQVTKIPFQNTQAGDYIFSATMNGKRFGDKIIRIKK